MTAISAVHRKDARALFRFRKSAAAGQHDLLAIVKMPAAFGPTRPQHRWHLVKVAGGGSWGFWGLEKSVKVLRKSLLQAVFFGFGIAGGIDGMRWEMISLNLGAISRVSYASRARFGGRG